MAGYTVARMCVSRTAGKNADTQYLSSMRVELYYLYVLEIELQAILCPSFPCRLLDLTLTFDILI